MNKTQPEWNFLMGLLCTLKSDEMKEMIKESEDNIALSNNNDVDMMIEVIDNGCDMLLGLLSYKSKCL